MGEQITPPEDTGTWLSGSAAETDHEKTLGGSRTEESEDVEEQQGSPPSRIKTSFGARPACFRNTFQEVSFVFQATVATATTSFLTGVGMIVTASIGRDLGMTQGEISWITASTSLVAGAFQLALGQLADLLGRKAMFVIGMGSFSAFVLVLAFAQNPFWMVILSGVLVSIDMFSCTCITCHVSTCSSGASSKTAVHF